MADLDHRFVVPPYLRITERKKTSSGDEVYLWQLRLSQPNVAQVSMPVVHSFEHFLGDTLRATREDVINIAPMGCQTGFYIAAMIDDYEQMAELIAGVLASIGAATSVPLADPVHCGWAENHSLIGVQELAAWLLRQRSEWADPGPAREL
ncbi:S-ribosylhomocysteine lyase [Amycolatopsis sp. K13G38]|uniref:S-ribosylhomocysteine lyase n=1 Tax=Amycolatopsis acididurans TaxID=2724524 RepID=A0ABX1J5T1_9PSEU|nr:S-ribosylhomocysteine lyase [Amycolatopsis acididurans]NKQ55019.1 S-ribosylhomocysteine lyase [Amycolatopsis acididurans]